MPKTIQEIIPIRRIYDDGIFLTEDEYYTIQYRFTDINFSVAGYDNLKEMSDGYQNILKSVDVEARMKITINNRKINPKEFRDNVLLKLRDEDDGNNSLRKEYNEILKEKLRGRNNIIQERLLTISIKRKTIEEARIYFGRTGSNLTTLFQSVGSNVVKLSTKERLEILHDFLNPKVEFDFDLKEYKSLGKDFRNALVPKSVKFNDDYIQLGDKFYRVLYLRDLPRRLKTDFLTKITDIASNMFVSYDITSIPTDEALKDLENLLLGVDTNITNWQRKQNQNDNFSATIPYEFAQQKEEIQSVLDKVTLEDNTITMMYLTIIHCADTLEELDKDTSNIIETAKVSNFVDISKLVYNQYRGLHTALPIGLNRFDTARTLTSSSAVGIMPFNVQDVFHRNGISFGNNSISGNVILVDRNQLMNGNSFILGTSGSGKSMEAKNEIINLILATDADVIIIDPEREYVPLVNALHGERVVLSASSDNHINALDINAEYGEGKNPLTDKVEFILSLCEQIDEVTPKQKSIIDRCCRYVYMNYIQSEYKGEIPTLVDFVEELSHQPEPEAKQLALSLELFTKGTLDTFAKKTNVDTQSRFICYDIQDLGEQLISIGLLVVLDSILNRITLNRANGKATYVFIDEIYLLFAHQYSSNFLFKLYKRVRKYGAFMTGITQNVTDVLASRDASTMMKNSELIIMMKQGNEDDCDELARLLNISETQIGYVKKAEAGHGLIKVGSSIIPFENEIPQDTQLYKLMTTKFGEV